MNMLRFPWSRRLAALVLLTCSLLRLPAGGASLPRGVPEQEGVSSAGLQAVVQELDQRNFGLHGLMVIRHGKVIGEGWWAPYRADQPHVLFSLSKSFTSIAVGIAQDEGLLSIHDPVLKFFPDEAPAQPSDKLKAMRVRDLLMMSTGQHEDDVNKVQYLGGGSVVRQFLALPVPHQPGTHFVYNTPATYMLSAIVQKVTGQTTVEYLRPRLFAPLGIENPQWETSDEGVSMGGFGLNLKLEDIAKFGQLLLQRGEWQGRRLLSAAYIEMASSRQTSNGSDPQSDWSQGYGFQFWRCIPGFYRGDGAFGQYCIVMPQYDTVVVMNSGTNDMGGVMKVIWDKLLPELRPAALPANPTAQQNLQKALTALQVPLPAGLTDSGPSPTWKDKRFRVAANRWSIEEIAIAADGSVSLKAQGRQQLIPVATSGWRDTGASPLFQQNPHLQLDTTVAQVAAGWRSADEWSSAVVFYRTPFALQLRLSLEQGKPTLTCLSNVAFAKNAPVLLELQAL